MSRKSENSKAGSEGDGDSIFSSYSNSPRKSPGQYKQYSFKNSLLVIIKNSATQPIFKNFGFKFFFLDPYRFFGKLTF